jgi:hypothetical protein
LTHFKAEGETLFQIVTADETRVHHFQLQTKRKSMEWHHPQYPQQKKFKLSPSAGNVMITIFWECERAILVAACREGKQSTPMPTSGC